MPSYFCPECDEDYPKAKAFDDCPVCATNTLFRANRTPTVSMEEGHRRLVSRQSHEAFSEWCVVNHRTEADPVPSMTVFLPSDYTYRDKQLADRVASLLDEHFPLTTQLHVVMTGL